MGNIKQLAFVVGIDKIKEATCYRVILAQLLETNTPKAYKWSFTAKKLSSSQIVGSAGKGLQWLNIKVVNGEIKGSTGDLSRFNNGKNHPYVIISKIESMSGKLLGYKVADYNGNVQNISAKDMIAFGKKATACGGIPVQNAKFIASDGYYCAYPGASFIEEVHITHNKPQAAANRKVDMAANEKAASKLSDTFNKEQIKQLKLGKDAGIIYKIYANPKLSAKQMEVLRKSLESGANAREVQLIAFPEYNDRVMGRYAADIIMKRDIRPYLNPKYSVDQVNCLSTAYLLGIDIGNLTSPELTPEQMEIEKSKLLNQLWGFAKVDRHESWNQYNG